MKQEFSAVIKQHEQINGAFIEIPFDVQAIFGSKRVKVTATFDGVPYKGSIVRMSGQYIIGLTKQIREEINKNFGDTVFITVEEDLSDRTVELPADFEKMIRQSRVAAEFWDSLSYSNRKKYASWIAAAKKQETREKRMNEAFLMLENRNKIK